MKGEDVHRLTISAGDVRSKSIAVHVTCYQHMRLRQHYEAALRRWEQVEPASNKNGFVDASIGLSGRKLADLDPASGSVFSI